MSEELLSVEPKVGDKLYTVYYYPHQPVYYEEDGTEKIGAENCEGEVYWEPVMEGYCCTECNFYTGVK